MPESPLLHRLTGACYSLLIGALLLGGIASDTPLVLVVIVTLPLLMFIPGLCKANPRSLIMLCFVSLLYFTVIVVNIFEPDRSIFDMIALLAVSILFTSAMLLSRQRRA